MLTHNPVLVVLSVLAFASATPIAKRASGHLIQSYRTGRCLSPASGKSGLSATADGTVLTTVDCGSAVLWDISPGSGSVIVSGTSLALDAGVDPHDFVSAKLWTSYPGLTQQTWYLTADNRIAITGGNQCLDEGDDGPQTYQCTTGNTNQIWYVYDGDTNNGSGGKGGSGPSGNNDPPAGAIYPDVAGQGRRIHPYNRADLCVTVMGATIVQASSVEITYCFANDDPNVQYQLWDLTPEFSGEIALSATTANGQYCLIGRTDPSDGDPISLDPCGTPYVLLNWTFESSGQLMIVDSNNQCLDVQLNSSPGNQSPYSSAQNLQSYDCTPGDTQQIFFLYDGN
ncbi:hypothetical protein P7C73_g1169, partial [Tremellales sp. Uapishka_1]